MKLTDDDIDYEALLKISEELTTVVSMAVGFSYTDLAKKALNITDSMITLQWHIFDHSRDYCDETRQIAAMCLWLLLEEEERRNEIL